MFRRQLKIMLAGLFLAGGMMNIIAYAGQATAGAVMINGQKTFPLGWYGLSWYHSPGPARTLPLTESSQHGFDYVMPYTPFAYATNQEILAYLDMAYSLGIKVVIDTHTNPVYKVTSMVNLVKNHPAVFGYYVEDEPEVRNISAAEVLSKYNAIKSADPNPNHPAILVLTRPLADHQAYLAACDIVGRELYNADQIATIESDVAVARAAGKSYIAIPRMYQARSAYALTVPTADEFKYLVFNPISKGAGGIMPFIFEGHIADGYAIPPAGFRDQSVYPVTDLLLQIKPTLLKGSDTLDANLDHWDELLHGGEVLSWVIAGDNSDAVLIVVNDSGQTLSNMDFTLVGLNPNITTATVLGEGRTVPLVNATISDNFGPYGVHIYKFYANPIPGDANSDGLVDVGDLGILAANYGTAGGATWSQGDFNHDGAVDVGDLGILAANYGTNASGALDFNADYAKTFGIGSLREDTAATDEIGSSICGGLGLPLLAGLVLMGLMLMKLKA